MRAGRPATLVAVAAWAAYWAAVFATGFAPDGWLWWAAVLGPCFALGWIVGRWWTVLLPFALVVLVPLAPDGCTVDCGELAAIPAWVLVATYLAPRCALAVAAGVLVRRLVARRRDRVEGGTSHSAPTRP